MQRKRELQVAQLFLFLYCALKAAHSVCLWPPVQKTFFSQMHEERGPFYIVLFYFFLNELLYRFYDNKILTFSLCLFFIEMYTLRGFQRHIEMVVFFLLYNSEVMFADLGVLLCRNGLIENGLIDEKESICFVSCSAASVLFFNNASQWNI